MFRFSCLMGAVGLCGTAAMAQQPALEARSGLPRPIFSICYIDSTGTVGVSGKAENGVVFWRLRPRANCKGGRASVVIYRSRPGFKGVDTAYVYASAHDRRDIRINVR